MDQSGEPKASPAAAPSHLRWDTSRLESHRCALAAASATEDEVILSFGTKLAHDGQEKDREDTHGREVGVKLLQRIALRPLTAKRLLEMLEKLLAERDARSRPST
jgi:hypothetical protein